MPSIFLSLIQSDFGGSDHGNFEAVIQVGGDLLHYFRANTAQDRSWRQVGTPVCVGNVVWPGALIQSDFGGGEHRNFEVAAPLRTQNGGVQLRHFFHANNVVSSPWVIMPHPVTNPSDLVTGPACLIQSDFKSGDHGNFEVVVPLRGPHGHDELWHYFHDNTNVDAPWVRLRRITGEWDRVAGPGAIIQSSFRRGSHGNYEVVVPIIGSHGLPQLWHYFLDNSDLGNEWIRLLHITEPWMNVAGGATIIQSDPGTGHDLNFEVVVPICHPHGHVELWHYFLDNTRVGNPWRRAQMITASASGPGCLISTDFSAHGHRNFEVLVEECGSAIASYWRGNFNLTDPWLRVGIVEDGPVRAQRPIAVLGDTQHICQLTDELTGKVGAGRIPEWIPNSRSTVQNRASASAAPTSVSPLSTKA